MNEPPYSDAYQRLFGQRPDAVGRVRLDAFVTRLHPDLRDDPAMLEFVSVLVNHIAQLDQRLAASPKKAFEEARREVEGVFSAAARKIAAAHPDKPALRAQLSRLFIGFGILMFLVAYLACIGLMKTGYLSYPHLSVTEQSQLDLGREIDARGNREAARWAAHAIQGNVQMSEVSTLVHDLSLGRNARNELAAMRQCRITGAQIVPHRGRWACLFPLEQ